MFKPGLDEDNVQMSDVLCDFCWTPWHEHLPLVEGHRGAVICGPCLTAAYRAAALNQRVTGDAIDAVMCLLCRETREGTLWRVPNGNPHPTEPLAAVCTRCVKQSAAVLAKDKDSGWTKPK